MNAIPTAADFAATARQIEQDRAEALAPFHAARQSAADQQTVAMTIREHLDAASRAADQLGIIEGSDGYAALAKLIDIALAAAERVEGAV